MTRRILITVPNLLRDLEGCALVGYHLERCFGHEVRYTTGRNLTTDLFAHVPDVLVLDQIAWDYRARQANLAKRLGCRLVVMPTSGLFQDMSQHSLVAGQAFQANGLVDRYLAWGEAARQALLSSATLSPERVRTVGCPRFDFYSAPYTRLFGERPDFFRRLGIPLREGPLITWTPGNVAYAATGRDDLKRWAAGTRVDPDIYREEMAESVHQYEEHAPWVTEIARRRPGWTVIVKVHPGDQLSRYLWMRERSANIHVVQNVPIRELLFHADVLLQWCSTTANEAWMLGKPVLSLTTARASLKIDAEYAAGNEPIRSADEAVLAVDRHLGDRRIPEAQLRSRDTFLEKTYFRVDGRSGERCAQVIDEIVSPPQHTDADQERIRRTAETVRTEFERPDIVRATDRLKALVGISPGRSLRFWKKPKRRVERAASGPVLVDDLYALFEPLHGRGCARVSLPGRGPGVTVGAS